MDGAQLSRYPHLSWLRFQVAGSRGQTQLVLPMDGVCLTVCCTFRGRQDVRQVTRGREACWQERAGTVNVLPADGDQHTFISTMSPDLDTVVWLIPPQHQHAILDSEGVSSSTIDRRMCAHDDPVLVRCMSRLASMQHGSDSGAECGADEAAHGLILRLAELFGGGTPDWHDDASVFDRRTLAHLVEYVDEHLARAPSLSDMALRTGLSPSHFARKFRLSTGLSLHRFVNRRRILRSLEMIRDQSQPLATVALELGFSSQSHFTRLFSMLTGLTPAKYRKQCERTVG